MPSDTQYPVQSHQPGPRRRHLTRESFTTSLTKFICTIFLGIVFILGLVAFILWLSLRPHRPRFYIISFSVAGLLNQDTGFENALITFNVTARNPNKNADIYYDEMSGNVFYLEQQLTSSTRLLMPFHQPSKNTTNIVGTFTGVSLATNAYTWKQALAAGTVVFRLELMSRIRFRVARWTTKHHRIHASCEVGVGPDGQMASTYEGRRCSIYFS